MYCIILEVCYNYHRDGMKEIKIKIYSFLNNIEENNEFLAIKNDNVIKYIDFSNNKIEIDIKNNTITKENTDYIFTLKFDANIIEIYMKKLKRTFTKEIKTLICSLSKKRYFVKYLLVDENIINEYYVNF